MPPPIPIPSGDRQGFEYSKFYRKYAFRSCDQTKYNERPGIDNPLSATVAGSTNCTYPLADDLGTAGITDSFGNGVYGFTGRYNDNFTGLMYYRARMYDPQLGRFISEDPIGFGGGDINLYGYVHSNPVNKRDPFGLIDPIVKQDPRIYVTNPEDLTTALDVFQAMFGAVGMIPIVGEPADGIDGLISLARGDYAGAGLSGASMIPFAGWGAGVTKFCRIGDRLSSAKTLYRPYIRKSIRETVESRAMRNADGLFLDANTLEAITEGKYHLGHKYGNQYWRIRDKALNDGLTQREFNDLLNDPDLYQLELPANNRSHRYEMPR